MKNIIKNNYKYIITFLVGALIVFFVKPKKIKIEKVVETKEVEVVKTKIEYKDRVVVEYRDRVVQEKIRKFTKTIITPDGTTIIEELYESVSEQIERIEKEEKKKYEQKLAIVEKEYQEKKSKTTTITNPKNLIVHAGVQANLTNLGITPSYAVGVTNNLFGKFTVTGLVDTNQNVSALIGFKF